MAEKCEELRSPAIASCRGGQDTVGGEKDVVGSGGVIMVDDEEELELVVDGEPDVVLAVVILWVYSEVTTSGLSWGGDG